MLILHDLQESNDFIKNWDIIIIIVIIIIIIIWKQMNGHNGNEIFILQKPSGSVVVSWDWMHPWTVWWT